MVQILQEEAGRGALVPSWVLGKDFIGQQEAEAATSPLLRGSDAGTLSSACLPLAPSVLWCVICLRKAQK